MTLAYEQEEEWSTPILLGSQKMVVYLDLIDLPLLVVFELIHILLEPLDFIVRGLLLLLRALNGSLEFLDQLLFSFDFSTNLGYRRIVSWR